MNYRRNIGQSAGIYLGATERAGCLPVTGPYVLLPRQKIKNDNITRFSHDQHTTRSKTAAGAASGTGQHDRDGRQRRRRSPVFDG